MINEIWKKNSQKSPFTTFVISNLLFFFCALFLTKTRCTHLSFFYSLQFQRTLTLDSSFSLKCLSLFNFRRKKNKYYLKSYLPTYFKKFHKIFVVMVVQLPFKLLSSLSGKWNIDECRQIVQYHLENIESSLISYHTLGLFWSRE